MKPALYISFLFLATSGAMAQVAVSQEPRHHTVLQNRYVRVLDVHIPPGDTSLFHIHARPSVFLILNHARTGSQVLSQGKSDHLPGDIYFEGFYDQARVHRVWNEDHFEFRVMDIELLKDEYKDPGAPIADTAFRLLLDEKPVRVYRLTLYPGQSTGLEKRTVPLLIVCLSDTAGPVLINSQLFSHQSSLIFVDAGNRFQFSNQGNATADFAILELK